MSIPHDQPWELAIVLPWRLPCLGAVCGMSQHPRVQIQHSSTLCFWEVLPAGTCLPPLPELAPVLSMWVVIEQPCRECGKHLCLGDQIPGELCWWLIIITAVQEAKSSVPGAGMEVNLWVFFNVLVGKPLIRAN